MEKIFSLFRTHKKPFILGVLAVLALSIPIIVAQVLKQQDIRQRAAAGDPVTLSFSPNSKTVNINDTIDVQLVMNTNTNDVSALDVTLKYDSTKLALQSVTAGSNYTYLSAANNPGSQNVVLVNQTSNVTTSSNIIAATFAFKAIAVGTAHISLDSSTIKIAASGFTGNVPLTNSSITGSYIINSSPTDTDTTHPTAILTPGGSTPTATPTTAPCLNEGIRDAGCPTATPTLTSVPTATSIPTVTIPSGGTGIQIVASVIGIGLSDGENHQPLHPDRTITVILSDFTTKTQVGSPIQSSLTYDSATGKFKGTANLGSSFATDTYDVKIKMDNTLYKKQQGITITSGLTTNQFPVTFALVPSDLDQDNRISISDYTIAAACVREPILPACTPNYVSLADVNDNGTNDSLDMVILQRGFSTPIEGD